MTTTTGALRPSTFVISITPFDANADLDEAAFRGHLRRLAASGIGVYVGGGGSGEGYTLSPDEAARVIEIAVEELKGKVPVRAMGTEPRTAKQMIEFVRMAKARNVDAVQIYALDVGHDVSPRGPEMEAYFNEVLESTDTPCVLSTHFSVGYRIPAELIIGFARRFPHVVGINCTHPDLGYLEAIINGMEGRIPVHVGGPMQGLTALSLGAQGYLASEGNLAPRLCVSVIENFEKNDLKATMESFAKVIRVFNVLQGAGGIRATKAVLNRLGLPGGYPRKPRLLADEEGVTRALAVIEALGLKAIEGW